MLKPGDTLLNGQYRILRQLGRGGFGYVYHARHTHLREEVAIKELIPGLVGEEQVLKRFIDEARATLRLRHERIVGTQDLVQERDNYHIIMEYMPGGSLEDRLKSEGPLPLPVALRIAGDVCQGLDHAHQQGIVHCDLKPANILFAADGTAKVADFGIAHVPEQALTRSWHTPAGFVAGTLPYMSPEQTEGVRDDLRIDIYAMGAVLFRMLTGHAYLDFDTRETPAAQAGNVNRIHQQAPVPPSSCNPSVPEWLDAIVLTSLSKRPEYRFDSTQAMADALESQTAPQRAPPPLTPVPALPSPVPVPTPSPAEKHRPSWPSQLRKAAEYQAPSLHSASQGASLPRWFWPTTAGAAALLLMIVFGLVALGRGGEPGQQTAIPGAQIARVSVTLTSPPTTSLPPATATQIAIPTSPTIQIYTVKEGDALYAIATQFGVTLESLLVANALKDASSIEVGMELIIPPGGGTPESATVPPSSTPSPTALPAPVSTNTAEPTDSPTSTPTATPVPPTPTPKPTKKPKPTKTPTPAGPSPGDTSRRPKDGMTMVYVPGGQFQMGSDDAQVDYALELCNQYKGGCNRSQFDEQRPAHSVTLDTFWIDRTEVTNAQFVAFLNENGNQNEGGKNWLDVSNEGSSIQGGGNQFQPKPGMNSHPVGHVTWYGASAYCRWAGARLPTEAEWEFAARGQKERTFPWGDTFDGSRLNYCDVNCADQRDASVNDGYAKSAPVGSFLRGASWVGAVDMAGNVWEWVADWRALYPGSPQVNPTGPASGDKKALRGGSWSNLPHGVRSTIRPQRKPDGSSGVWGFRCARDA